MSTQKSAKTIVFTASSGGDYEIELRIVDDQAADSTDHANEDLRKFELVVSTTSHEWRWLKSLDLCASELELNPTSKHAIFTRRNVVTAITSLIENKKVEFLRHPTDQNAPIAVTFTLTMHGDVLPEIRDELTLSLDLLARPPNTTDTVARVPIAELTKRVEEQDKEIKRLTSLISDIHTLAQGAAKVDKSTVVQPDGTRVWYLNGKLHRVDGPAVEGADGLREWYLNGLRHREDGPAVEYVDGTRAWYRNGKRHRVDGPAIERANGTREWIRNDLRHREDGPAIEYLDGTREWWLDGKRHREDGPAVEYVDGTRAWYRNGLHHRIDGPAIEYPDGTRIWCNNDGVLTRVEHPVM